ncbi:hypothetical protein AVEN_41499-1 [Araneus ventricosus]|uniref:SOCS box domain-containing protein n=1 Tax=Araneus ventricosus TaxID=182803 RepID=A0A4Y2HBW5_ARAVE|nr:hypothetical protein AVEN_41499-1 [Araneus ventricosus]
MSMDRFATDLRYRVVNLETAASIVMLSFASHKTVSHLDLQISQRALSDHRQFPLWDGRSVKKSFFCTEESLRNKLEPKRRLLYNLHLDFPHGREYSNFKNDFLPLWSLNDFSLFVGVRLPSYILIDMLIEQMEQAFEQTDCKFKLLKWMADFRPLELASIPERFQLSCAKLLYHECVDSEFAAKFFDKFIELNSFHSTEVLKVLEYFLYHARVCDFHVRSRMMHSSSVADVCIQALNFRIVHSILKYEDTAYYTEKCYLVYKSLVGRFVDKEDMKKPENQMSKLRLYRMLQIIFIFQNLRTFIVPGGLLDRSDALEALRLVWSSIPDSFVSLQEMNDAYERVLYTVDISEAHIFYEEAISQTVLSREPRPLSQYCRSAIRKKLILSSQWLPDGIKQLKLPPRLESFLNLERDNLRLENFQAL